MKLIAQSRLADYAKAFWDRQRAKSCHDDRRALREIDSGSSGVAQLVDLYPYKLPSPTNARIEIAELERAEELDSLLIHDYMLGDDWMNERSIHPNPKSRRLCHLADTCLDIGYFRSHRSDQQTRVFLECRKQGTLEGFVESLGMPLIEEKWPNEYEIVDGWGRLLPMAALIRSGIGFHPFRCFVASQKGIEQEHGETTQDSALGSTDS